MLLRLSLQALYLFAEDCSTQHLRPRELCLLRAVPVAPELESKMGSVLEVEQVNAVEAVESSVFEIRLLLQDGSDAMLRLNGPTLCSLADMVSQYATP
jgi:hypothetical protein